MVTAGSSERVGILTGKRVAFVGKLGGLNRRDAAQLIRRHGGTVIEAASGNADVIVIGAEELPLGDEGLLDPTLRQAADDGRIEIITETELWERLGLLDEEARQRRYYTPAMLAELLQVPVSTIRRWHRRGLIVPAKEVHRLPYFAYQEVASARRLANMIAAGMSPAAIEQKLAALARYVGGVQRPLAQLSVIVEGRQLLLRQGEGLVEPGGQLRFDFETLERNADQDTQGLPATSAPFKEFLSQCSTARQIPASDNDGSGEPTVDQLQKSAEECEALGQFESAVELYRSALALGGPRAEICFQLAEVLYRHGDVPAARERYYVAIELDEELVEARANLGCILAEEGEWGLAIAAFQGALALHPEYADAHYQLARTFVECGRRDEADHHWREFLRLAPDSPWADEARRWINSSEPAESVDPGKDA